MRESVAGRMSVVSRDLTGPLRQVVLVTGLLGLGVLAALGIAGGGVSAPVAVGPARAPAVSRASTARAVVPRSAERVLGAGEYVYGPALRGFDTAAALAAHGGAIQAYRESTGDGDRTAAEIIDRVALEHSVSPKVLLALLEQATGAVTDPAAGDRLARPFGNAQTATGLDGGLRTVAAWMDDGFYGLRLRDTTTVIFADGTEQAGPTGNGAAHFAVARLLAMTRTSGELPAALAAFADTYRRLFGDIPAELVDAVPVRTAQPPLLLPWPAGERWYFTGGPHGAWGIATAWGGVDFAPPSMVGCAAAPEWVVAAAPGLVTRSAYGYVVEDLDGDGFEGTGWVLVYLHMATAERTPAGTWLAAGDRVGHPSCEGGRSTGAHLHLARRLNGEWLPAAGGSAPLELSGWTFEGSNREYDGSMNHAQEEQRDAVTSQRGGPADIVSDNGPERHAALAAAWQVLQASPAMASADDQPPGSVAGAGVTLAEAGPATGITMAAAVATVPRPAAQSGPGLAPTAGDGVGAPIDLVVTLWLPGRPAQDTTFEVVVAVPTGQEWTFGGATDATGTSRPITLMGVVPGEHTVTVRVPGYRPLTLYAVALVPGETRLDLSREPARLEPGA